MVIGGSEDKKNPKFCIVGKSHGQMCELFERRKFSTQHFSFQARVSGTVHLGETIRPISTSLMNSVRTCMRDNFVAKLRRTDYLRNVQIVKVIDPPVEIAHIADILQCQIQKDSPGKALSDAFAFTCNKAALCWHNFLCCLGKIRCRGEQSKLPPKHEMI
jgi:hypothetical protein